MAQKQAIDYETGLKLKLDRLLADAALEGRKVSTKEMKELIRGYSQSFQNTRTGATVTTETNRVANDMRLDLYQELGTAKVVYTAVMDDRTTKLCSDLNGTVLAVDDPRVARLTPPNHVHCRSYWTDLPPDSRKKRTTTKVINRRVDSPQLNQVREVMNID